MQPQGHLQATPGNAVLRVFEVLRGSKFRGVQGLGIVLRFLQSLRVKNASRLGLGLYIAKGLCGFGEVQRWRALVRRTAKVFGKQGQQCVTGPAQKSWNIIAPLTTYTPKKCGTSGLSACLFH